VVCLPSRKSKNNCKRRSRKLRLSCYEVLANGHVSQCLINAVLGNWESRTSASCRVIVPIVMAETALPDFCCPGERTATRTVIYEDFVAIFFENSAGNSFHRHLDSVAGLLSRVFPPRAAARRLPISRTIDQSKSPHLLRLGKTATSIQGLNGGSTPPTTPRRPTSVAFGSMF
jgi:hypothetical protein